MRWEPNSPDLSRILSTTAVFSNVVSLWSLVRNTSLSQIWQLKPILIYDLTVLQFRSPAHCDQIICSGSHQAKVKVSAGLGLGSKGLSTSKTRQVTGRIQFNTVVGLRSCPCCQPEVVLGFWRLPHSLAHDALHLQSQQQQTMYFSCVHSFWHPLLPHL